MQIGNEKYQFWPRTSCTWGQSLGLLTALIQSHIQRLQLPLTFKNWTASLFLEEWEDLDLIWCMDMVKWCMWLSEAPTVSHAMHKLCTTPDLLGFSHRLHTQHGCLSCFLARVEFTSFITISVILKYQPMFLTLLVTQTKESHVCRLLTGETHDQALAGLYTLRILLHHGFSGGTKRHSLIGQERTCCWIDFEQ